MSAQGMLRPIEKEYLRRNPGVTVTSRTLKGQKNIPEGHVFDRWGAAYGRQALAAGLLDEGKAQPQFGSRGNMRLQNISRPQKSSTPEKPAPPKAKTASQKAKPAPAIQKTGRVPTVKRKTQSRGRTIMNPLASKNEGSTYRKKLLGE